MNETIYDSILFDTIDVTDEYVLVKGYANRYKYNDSIEVDDHNTVFTPASYNLDDYKLNPVILYNHQVDKPVGRAAEMKITENGLYIEAKIFKDIDEQIYTAVKTGALSAFSIGIYIHAEHYSDILDAYVVDYGTLVEVSLVTMPSNTKSTIENIDLCSMGVCSVLRSKDTTTVNSMDKQIIKRMVAELLETN